VTQRARAREGKAEQPGGIDPPEGSYVAIVRRGETAVFRMLLRALDVQPGLVQVIWDRRGADRRQRRAAAPRNRRRTERRTPPPPTWRTLGFFFAPSRGAGP